MELSSKLIRDIGFNCDISDAKGHGLYSLCTMFLTLRNHYKWEKKLAPWSEPEPADLLDWIEQKENYWQQLQHQSLKGLRLGTTVIEPFEVERINNLLGNDKRYYGAGYGRSMKSIFFLAEIVQQKTTAGLPVVILGREIVREMASPFALLQSGSIIIRKEPFRYYLWDQLQELHGSSRRSFRPFLDHYDLLKDDVLDLQQLRRRLDTIVDQQLEMIIRHEVGECNQKALGMTTVKKMIVRFPGSRIEHICRAIKDVLADTCPDGVLAFIISEQKLSSLSLFLGLLDGLREVLLKELVRVSRPHGPCPDWQQLSQAREHCWQRLAKSAAQLNELADQLEACSNANVSAQFERQIAAPLGLS